MGIRKVFQKKDPTEDEVRKSMEKAGIMTKNRYGGAREEKFGAFKAYADDRNSRKPGFAPVNPYANQGAAAGGNPYAVGTNSGVDRPQNGAPGAAGASDGNPYGGRPDASNPYGSARQSAPSGHPGQKPRANNPYGSSSRSQSQSTRQSSSKASARSDPYSGSTARSSRSSAANPYDTESVDLNAVPDSSIFEGKTKARRPTKPETYDLNEDPDEDLNLDIPDEAYDEAADVNSEDEEIEAIKQDIRFTKQESLASTRNTLRMAQEADAAATNTLGMLGSQSERLYHAEQNLLLAGTQTKLAEDKVDELKRLNRSIFVPAYGNPFNKKSRLRRQEEEIKSRRAQEKYIRETNRQEMYSSEQRVKAGLTANATSGEVYQRYQGEKDLAAAQRYQFENDSEDDEMEKELAQNLDQIGLYAKKLKSSAKNMGVEVDSQNARLNKIEEDADRLDINVHMNTTRLANIR
ncbi:protein transport protein Sec9p [Diutina catenulata]